MKLDPRTTAVIAVHLQGDIVGPDGAQAEIFHEQVVTRDVLRVIGGILRTARSAGSDVISGRLVVTRAGVRDSVHGAHHDALMPH